MESSNSWRTKLWSSIALCQSRSKYARKEQTVRGKQSKENREQQLQSSFALLEHFPKSIFYLLYTISKLRKSRIQCFKRCTIRSWNEGVTAIASRSLQSVAKSAFCCENFAAFLYSAMEFLLKLPDTCRKLERWEPQGGSQFRSPTSLTCCCENISQPSWVSAKSRRHHFHLWNVLSASWYLCTDSFRSFLQIFLYKFPFFSL